MSTTVATCNLRFTLSVAAFEHGLRLVLADHPDICVLQEAGPNRDHAIEKVCAELGYAWARAKGGEPVLWKIARYGKTPRSVHPVLLARAEFVGHLIGRKDRLPPSIATEVCLDDVTAKHPDGAVTVVLDYHLTAEVQYGARYRRDPAHLLRVMRHKREKRRLGGRARMQHRHGRTVYPAGDGNFDGMTLGGFVSCWTDHHGGTLGGRAVDIIFAATKAPKLWTIQTPSDHDSLVVTYS